MMRIKVYVLLVSCVFLIACGLSQTMRDMVSPIGTPAPIPLTDAEFSEAAREVCTVLKADLTSADSFADKADAYRQAAVGLSEFEVTELSAPQGFLLRSSLSELANTYDQLDVAITDALKKAGIQGPVQVGMNKLGFVTVNFKILDIDKSLVLKLYELDTVVRNTAISFGLDDCAVEE